MPSVLITGANRGLGHEFTRQYGADGWRVFACCRTLGDATDLAEIAARHPNDVSVYEMEVTDRASVATVAEALRGEAIDLLISNVGVLGRGRSWELGKTDYDTWGGTLEVNVMGATRALEIFSDHVARSECKQMVTISSKLGSITLAKATSNLAYRTSKAAVNMAVKCVADALAGRGVICAAVSPGWVQTDMGGANADLTPEESVGNMRGVFETLGPEHTGRFLNHDGSELPW
jgi:NAD(P)-dependent dehydrogenase (short-subunit alcohol dehydrogenase family)